MHCVICLWLPLFCFALFCCGHEEERENWVVWCGVGTAGWVVLDRETIFLKYFECGLYNAMA